MGGLIRIWRRLNTGCINPLTLFFFVPTILCGGTYYSPDSSSSVGVASLKTAFGSVLVLLACSFYITDGIAWRLFGETFLYFLF